MDLPRARKLMRSGLALAALPPASSAFWEPRARTWTHGQSDSSPPKDPVEKEQRALPRMPARTASPSCAPIESSQRPHTVPRNRTENARAGRDLRAQQFAGGKNGCLVKEHSSLGLVTGATPDSAPAAGLELRGLPPVTPRHMSPRGRRSATEQLTGLEL